MLGLQEGTTIGHLAHKMNDDIVHAQAFCASLYGLCNAQFDELCD